MRIRRISLICIAIILLLSMSVSVFALSAGNGTTIYVSDNSSTFDPGGATYSRIICLKNSGTQNGTLLCTYDQLKNVTVTMPDGSTVSKQVYPIYKSTNDGASWTLIANVYDREFGLNRTSQPCLFELPQAVGSLPKGTIILAGNIFDDDPHTVSRIVLYKSSDGGYTWTYLSQVDAGGPCVYDPSTTSTTTTVWEPFLNISADGKLVCYYSDERQKSSGALQTVCLRASEDGITWGNLANVAAITNTSDRPGMITVTKLPNGTYMATYEVVNRPSISLNNAVVYCKFSADGLTWDASSLGTRVALSNGRGIGSSPFVKWVDAGGPNGMVIISAKWATDSSDVISGGQNFYVNYNLGKGSWERLPMAVTYDYNDSAGGYFSGFSQSFDVSAGGSTLYHATNVENLDNVKTINGTQYHLNDVRVDKFSLNGTIYEAENATLNNVSVGTNVDASAGSEVQYINYSDSSVTFSNVTVPSSGTYTVNVRYSNANGSTSYHYVKVNGTQVTTLGYPETSDWSRYQWASFTCSLNAGVNTIRLGYSSGFAEIDCIQVEESYSAVLIENRNSGKFIEVPYASVTAGTALGQWGTTKHMCQKWSFIETSDGYFRIMNLNSGLYLDIQNNSTANGASAVQAAYSSAYSQQWSLEECSTDGYFYIVNRGSGLYLEVADNLTTDGAAIGQWGVTGYGCQEWRFVKEGEF